MSWKEDVWRWSAKLGLTGLGLAAVFLPLEVAVRLSPGTFQPGMVRSPSEVEQLQEEEEKKLHSAYGTRSPYEQFPAKGVNLVGQRLISYTFYGADFTADIRYNSWGIRDREASELPPGDSVILMLGDSFVEGRQLPFEQTLPQQVESHLKSRDERYSVVNAGIGGTGTTNALGLLRHMGGVYRPQIVVLVFYLGNDPRNNDLILDTLFRESRRQGRSARPVLDSTREGYYWKEPGEFRHRFISSGSSLSSQMTTSQFKEFQDSVARFRECTQETTGIVSWAVQSSQFVRMLADRLGPNRCEPEIDGVPLFLLFETTASPEHQARAWETTAYLLSEIKESTLSLNSGLLVAYLPDRIDIDADRRERTFKYYGISEERLAPLPPVERMQVLLDKLGIAGLDLTQALTRQKEIDDLYLPIDQHLNRKGAGVVARAIAAAVKSLPASPAGVENSED